MKGLSGDYTAKMRRIGLRQSSIVGHGVGLASSQAVSSSSCWLRCAVGEFRAQGFATLSSASSSRSLARRSHVWIPTEKENPSDAAIPSHQLLVRGGFIRKHGFGLYAFLPLGKKVLNRIEQLIDVEMFRIGGNKLDLPLMIPNSLWKQSGRWQVKTPELVTLQDRRDEVFCLAPTHEESVSSLVAQNFRPNVNANANANSHTTGTNDNDNSSSAAECSSSLRVYQIGKKFRDEIRPRFGLLRAREFIMKDMYSFDTSNANSQSTYHDVVQAYHAILASKLQLPIAQVEADTGNIGGNLSHEFHVLSQVGEDTLLSCHNSSGCGYAANIEKAHGIVPSKSIPSHQLPTNGATYPATIQELFSALQLNLKLLSQGSNTTQNNVHVDIWQQVLVLSEQFGRLQHRPEDGAHPEQPALTGFTCRAFLCTTSTKDDEDSAKASPANTKSFVKTSKTLVLAFVRADRVVNGFSLKPFLPDQNEPQVIPFAEALNLLRDQQQQRQQQSSIQCRVFVDDSLAVDTLKEPTADPAVKLLWQVLETLGNSSNSSSADQFQVTTGNFREAKEGDWCGKCGVAPLEQHRGIEVGHVFYLGTKYSQPFSANNNNGTPLEMGCYGMGVSRLMAAIVEASHDDKGIIWPVAVAPFKIVVLTIGKTLANDADCPLKQAAYQVANCLTTLCERHANHDAGAGTGGIGGGDVLLDDRWKESAGSKLAESELLGVPYRVVLGKRFLKEGLVEVQTRKTMVREYLSLEQLERFFDERADAGEL